MPPKWQNIEMDLDRLCDMKIFSDCGILILTVNQHELSLMRDLLEIVERVDASNPFEISRL